MAVGSYTCIITDGVGCTSSQVVTVTTSPQPSASFSATPTAGTAPLVVNFTNTSQNANTYSWIFGDGGTSSLLNPTHTYTAAGTYIAILAVSNSNGCWDTIKMTIEVSDEFMVIVPNVFSPNTDGTNDVFYINSKGLKELDAEIYDRWGLKMYEWHTIKGGWDGFTAAGLPASDGTYYYIITLTEEFSNKKHV